MAKRQHRLTPEERRRSRRVLVALGCCAALVVFVFLLAWAPWPWREVPIEGDHDHRTPPHGGVLASLGVREPHDHAEALLEPGGALTIFMLGDDARAPCAVHRQMLAARVRAEPDENPATVVLVPMPQPGDPPSTTSRFKGRLAGALWGRSVSVTVTDLRVAEGRFRVEFQGLKSPSDEAGHEAELRRLYLTPGGKYTAGDIEANGGTTAARKYAAYEAAHELAPVEEGWLCPVAAARSEPGVSWAVDGRTYRFCCSPCVDEFVRLAKTRPDLVRPPEAYWKR